jgi:hypothetical protein
VRRGDADGFLDLVFSTTKFMKRMKRRQMAVILSAGVGAMDAVTGLLLVVAPAMVLRMMGIAPVHPEGFVFLSWMGVFIGGVGLSYGFALRGGVAAETVWRITAMVRVLVGVFVISKCAAGDLTSAWLTVAVTDLVVAMVQWFGLRAGWWREAA